MTRRLTATIAIALLGLLMTPASFAQAPVQETPEPTPTPVPWTTPVLEADAAILVDLDTNAVLFSQNAGVQRAPASLTKVVTALVVRETYNLDELVTVSPRSAATPASRIGLETGMTFPVRDLLWALLMKSSNDAGVALAEHHPAGYDHFIELMNVKARSLGAFSSHFENPHGLDAPGHVSSARDMAALGRELLADPLLAEIVSTRERTMTWIDGTERHLVNSNKLLQRYPGAIGMKTGFTNDAGRCLLAVADLPTGRMLTVVLGADDHYGETTKLLDYAKGLALRPEPEGDSVPADPEPVPEDEVELAAPPPPPADVAAAPVAIPGVAEEYRWAAVLALLAAAMLLTLSSRRVHPLREAAQFHGWLEPLLPSRRRR